jgi:hypothetical protein
MIRSKFYYFFIINFVLIFLINSFFIFISNGYKNPVPTDMLIISLIISVPIIIAQFPILNLKTNWLYRVIIFYLSMSLFLFFFGFFMELISHRKIVLSECFDAGFITLIVGHIYGLIGMIPVIITNYSLRKVILK